MKLEISDSLSLPIDAVTQKFGILGRTGSGKTYGANKLAEEMLDAKAQIVALDPVGVWFGLRVAKDGKSEGYKIPVLGGLHGDIPLEPAAGALIADLIVDREISAVVDVSGFLIGEQRRFATDFAVQLFHRKKSQRSALHLFVEEAQEFVPQHVRGDVAKMVGAFERLLKLGRNFGIGATLISQRPQSVNKDVLNQTECLLAFQMTGPQERKAIAGWIAEKGLDTDIVNELPKLKIGECYIWSPQWLEISEKIMIAPKKTADVSSTPKPGVKPIEPKQLSQVELENLSDKMLATIERAKQEDPKALRAEVAGLQRELAKKPVLEKCNTSIKTIEKPVLKDSQIDRLSKLLDFAALNEQFEERLSRATKPMMDRFVKIDETMQSILGAINQVRSGAPLARNLPQTFHSRPRQIRPAPSHRQPKEQPRPAVNGSSEDVRLGIGERRCAIAIAQHYRNGVTREQLTTLTGYKRSTRNTYLQRLMNAYFVGEDGGRFVITPNGTDWLGDYEPLPTGQALQDYWQQKLPRGEREIFLVVLEHPDGISRDEISEATNFKRSTRNTYLQRLAARELVIANGETIRPSETLFEEADA